MKKVMWGMLLVLVLGAGVFYYWDKNNKTSNVNNENNIINQKANQPVKKPKAKAEAKPAKEEEQIKKEKEEAKEPKKEEAEPSKSSDDNKTLSWSFVRKKDHLPPAFENKEYQLAKKYNAIFLGDTEKKEIYLTFDEGYENGYTGKILDTLKANDVKASFFITYPYFEKEYGLVDRMVKEGHIVGNHTWHHPSMPDVTDDDKLEEEMLKLDREFKEKTGIAMKYLRPPKGEFSQRTLRISKELGYRNVFWSMAYADWDIHSQKGPDYARQKVLDNIHNGAVILLHAVSSDNAAALDGIIKELKAQEYVFASLDQIK
jgi:peptidoglycan-N-acetylmuramic acid deacetylase